MFAAFECDSITVPSCTKHNNEKSARDRAIISVLVKSLSRAIEGGLIASSLPQNVIKAIELLKPNFAQANREITNRSWLADPELDFAIPSINVSVYDWMRQLSAALVWSVTGEFDSSIEWKEAYVWNSLYLQPSSPLSVYDAGLQVLMNQGSVAHIESFDWKPGWSSSPRAYPSEIYDLRVCFSPPFEQNKGREVAFRHQFYSRLNWYVWFTPSVKTREALRQAVYNPA